LGKDYTETLITDESGYIGEDMIVLSFDRGWFHIGDEKIIIFDTDKEDKSRINNDVAPDSTVQEIVLAYWKHFD
jgi:hypothetical protein